MASNLLCALSFVAMTSFKLVLADSNGMDMSMDGAMDLSSGNMLSYLHFTPGDTLWFLGWVPSSKGAMVGVCIGLFLLALVERWLAAVRGVMEVHWAVRAQIELSNRLNVRAGLPTPGTNTDEKITSQRSSSLLGLPRRGAMPPFIPAHDISRGVLHVGQTALSFLFMLAVMTFQASFIISIIIGLGVGETLFGRYLHPVH
ncbi:CTR copper uptake transporter [Stereum hirsutum FP-91666 SS1]|uniref:CTR copper uptake transporter n=1 Tax=Stereum hirsutum (strain FP-91666) TaxID=721885 RepID=UPI000444A62A|nr:CTR copper uptake transporter [Stereum hirsutum FP-91666 SS1]EIM84484.1 CTR copper uptake transporter [Stereum hirsutum FP-91666 SS1]